MLNDGFNWFVLGVLSIGVIIGIAIGLNVESWAKVIALLLFIFAAFAFWRFKVTPVKGVEDDQE